ncbi:unnamed protein product, partial [marine sediment metagenome]
MAKKKTTRKSRAAAKNRKYDAKAAKRVKQYGGRESAAKKWSKHGIHSLEIQGLRKSAAEERRVLSALRARD